MNAPAVNLPARDRPVPVWPALLAPVGGLVALFIGANIAALVVMLVHAIRVGLDESAPTDVSEGMQAALTEPMALALMATFGQLAMVLYAVGIGLSARGRWRFRLGLIAPAMPGWMWLLLVPANLFVWLAATVGFSLLFTEPNEHMEGLADLVFGQGLAGRVLLLLGVAVLPGIGEELVTRGFLFRRLLRSWGRTGVGALLAVLTTSVVFAMMHMDPQHMLLIFPLSLWWTFVTWRTGSTLPAMVLHGFNNGWVLILAWVMHDLGLAGGVEAELVSPELVSPELVSTEPVVTASGGIGDVVASVGPAWLVIVAVGVGGPALLASVVVLLRRPAPAQASA